MNFDIIVTSNTFSSNCMVYMLSKNFDISIAQILPEINVIKDMPLFIPFATFKNFNIAIKIIQEFFVTTNEVHLFLLNNKKIIKSTKKIVVSATLEKIKKFFQNFTKNSRKIKTFQSSIKEIYFKDNKIFLRLSNNKLLSAQYLIIGDDFWGNIWNLLNYKPCHNGGWIIKNPTNSLKDIPFFISFGFSKKGIVLSNSEQLIFAKHIDKQYLIEDLINNFLLNNTIINQISIKEWNRLVLPFTTQEYTYPESIKNQRIFIISEYLGLSTPFIPDYTYLTSLLVKELVNNIDEKIKTFEEFLPILNKIIQYNKIFFKISNFINNFPLMFFKNDEKEEILANFFLGNIDPPTMNEKFKNIFDKYDLEFEIILSDKALKEE